MASSEAIAAMHFFAVPTLTFGVLYCFFVIAHDRRRILHFNVSMHPTSAWIMQQLREAFPYDSAPKYLIFDRGSNFNNEVIDTMKCFGITPKRTSFRSPWHASLCPPRYATDRSRSPCLSAANTGAPSFCGYYSCETGRPVVLLPTFAMRGN